MHQQLGFSLLWLMFALLTAQVASAQITTIRINEVLAKNLSYSNSDGSATDLVELYNSGGSPVDLSGSSLTDSNIFPRRFVFTNGPTIQPGEFLRLMCDARFSNNLAFARPPIGVKVPFGLKAGGGYFFFYGPADPITPISYVEYGLQIPDFSIGRVIDGSGPWELTLPTFGGPNVVAALGSRYNVRINEWLVKGLPDFVELYSPTNKPVSIGGMYLSDTVFPVTQFRIPDLSFIAGGDMGGFVRFNCEGTNKTLKYPADETNFTLENNELLVFMDTNGLAVVDFIPNWGTIHTSDVSAGRLPDGSTNIVFFPQINDYYTSSPGEPNFSFLIFPYANSIVVNELLSHTDPPLEDAIEFQNRAATNINISGWWLSNSRFNRKKFLIPNGPAIPPGGFRVFYEGVGSTNGFNSSSTNAVQPFTFNSAHGDQVVLSQVDSNGNLTGYVVYEEFDSSANGVSFGHYDTSVPGDYKFVAMSTTTFGFDRPNTVLEFRQGSGQTNAYPKVGPVVINEIMFASSNTVYGTNLVPVQNHEEEYIELRNITSNSVPLFDPQYPTNRWKLQSAISFVFPLTNLAPNSFCLVVGFDPATNAGALANFRTRYTLSNDVPIFGPWIGRLNDAGDAIELYRPDTVQGPDRPDAGFVPFIRIDKANYRSRKSVPWPGGANGTGFSLQRKNSRLFGNDPFNWAADLPNAGRASLALQDTDGDGIPDVWETAHGFNPNDPTDAALDTDNDGVTNLGEYLGGSDPRGDQNSVLRILNFIPSTNGIMPVIIRFLAYSNTSYTVQYRKSMLPSADWTRVTDVLPAASNRVVEVFDSSSFSKTDRYYRIVAPMVD